MYNETVNIRERFHLQLVVMLRFLAAAFPDVSDDGGLRRSDNVYYRCVIIDSVWTIYVMLPVFILCVYYTDNCLMTEGST